MERFVNRGEKRSRNSAVKHIAKKKRVKKSRKVKDRSDKTNSRKTRSSAKRATSVEDRDEAARDIGGVDRPLPVNTENEEETDNELLDFEKFVDKPWENFENEGEEAVLAQEFWPELPPIKLQSPERDPGKEGVTNKDGDCERSQERGLEFVADLTHDTAKDSDLKARDDLAEKASSTSNEPDFGFHIGEVQYAEVTDRLQKIVESRVLPQRVCPKSRKRKGTVNREQLQQKDRQSNSIYERWVQDISMLKEKKPDFFSSSEATLLDESASRKGKPVYQGIPLTQFNNADIQSIFSIEFERKGMCGGSYGSFFQLNIAAGQFMRLRVVRRLSELKKMSEEGELFRSICDRETVDLFLRHFDARSQCTTVLAKAFQLKKIAEHAVMFFTDRDRHLCAEAERTRLKLQKIVNVQKSLYRRAAAQKKSLDNRIADGNIFLREDFEKGWGHAKRHLNGMMKTYKRIVGERGERHACTQFEDQGLIRKWFINFLLLFIFAAGGQRPQVYAKLQTPTPEELRDMKESVRKNDYFELRTSMEKTQRSLDMPNVVVPGFVFKFLPFHVQVMRNIVLKKAGVDESLCHEKPLIIHTESGDALVTPQITRTLKGYLEVKMPEARHITMMNLRSSHCTMLMKAYRGKELFRNLTETEFLEMLGKSLNTSTEQLLTTYIGIDNSDYVEAAKQLVSIAGSNADTHADEEGEE